ncbi:hypothetical protein [Halorubrum sp. F4]|uniref:hypothetical protein n=1 Tax=Halorubrum sp. F4 TaxID=2989715 RepID=UPI00248130BC|nr:hypothetical protein [Halorubrum sp. F4]
MSALADHYHICGECGLKTIHHVHCHESIGDPVEFWCRHCEEDVSGTVGGFFA